MTTYKVQLLSGEVITIRLPRPLPVGKKTQVYVSSRQATYDLLCTSKDEVMEVPLVSNITGSDIAAGLVAGVLTMSLLWSCWASTVGQNGDKPDSAVLAAARQAGANVTVTDSEYSMWQGCDRRDSRVYRVYKDGAQVAIVCRGSNLTFFGIPTKAPTLRYVDGSN